MRLCCTDRRAHGLTLPVSGFRRCGWTAGARARACGSGHGRQWSHRSPDADFLGVLFGMSGHVLARSHVRVDPVRLVPLEAILHRCKFFITNGFCPVSTGSGCARNPCVVHDQTRSGKHRGQRGDAGGDRRLRVDGRAEPAAAVARAAGRRRAPRLRHPPRGCRDGHRERVAPEASTMPSMSMATGLPLGLRTADARHHGQVPALTSPSVQQSG